MTWHIIIDYCFNKWAGKHGQSRQLSDQALEWRHVHHFIRTLYHNQIENTIWIEWKMTQLASDVGVQVFDVYSWDTTRNYHEINNHKVLIDISFQLTHRICFHAEKLRFAKTFHENPESRCSSETNFNNRPSEKAFQIKVTCCKEGHKKYEERCF